MDSWVSWVIQTITMLGVGALGFFLKQTLSRLREDISQNAAQIKSVEEKLNRTIEEMPFKFTKQDDFIRAMASVEQRLDKILDKLSER